MVPLSYTYRATFNYSNNNGDIYDDDDDNDDDDDDTDNDTDTDTDADADYDIIQWNLPERPPLLNGHLSMIPNLYFSVKSLHLG